MAYTINLDDDIISQEELNLLRTKQAILAKLRVRFGQVPPNGTWPTGQQPVSEPANIRPTSASG